MKPIALGPNQLHRFYRGGAALAEFRGGEPSDNYAPEDWVGSTTTAFGESRMGLSELPDGTLLRDALSSCSTRVSGCRYTAILTTPSPSDGSASLTARPRPG